MGARQVNAAASPALALKFPVWRSRLLLVVLVGWFVALGARALYLQGLHNDFLQAKGESRYSRVISLSATRGMIVDRHNEPLAISTPVESVAASPADIEITAQQRARLARLLDMKADELSRRIAETKREFVYLKRQLPPEHAAKIVELGIPGVFLQLEYRRYYPGGEVMAHLIGFTDIDEKGQEALELAFESTLNGKPGSRRVIKDRRGHIVEDIESVREPQHGAKLTLSVDARIQYLAFRELKKAVTDHRAKAGGVVVLDAQTGEVLAMANLPTYNPNNRGKFDPKRTRNRAVTDLFEPGSTLKPFTAAAAIEAGVVNPGTVIQTAPGQLTIGNRTIRDAHPHGALSVMQVIQKSSNVGAAKMALSLPSETLWKVFRSVGFGAMPDSGFPGEVPGKLRPYSTWKPIEQATMSYGHGISVSLLQLARAYSIFATDGTLVPLTLQKRESPAEAVRVLKPETARSLRAMLELAVQPGGTAPKAQIAGYRVGGKTGTAHKIEGRGYTNKYISSFVGLAPASQPRLIVAVMIDEPSAGQYYGGAVAAPVFSQVMAGALRLLSIAPDAPVNNVVLPPASDPEVKEDAWPL
ncbi:MAG: peptidoglycan D,D-transpeptidase FtsI family protein [Burkholderiales bacterium]